MYQEIRRASLNSLALFANFTWRRVLITLACPVALAACSTATTECPLPASGDSAPSAGCFATSAGGLLLVQDLSGKISLPGGSAKPGESAQCTAYRETWEESGLRIAPQELLKVFDTGFHLYRCEVSAASGQIDPPRPLEIRAAFFLQPDQFEDYQWRYEGQGIELKAMLLQQSQTAE